MRRILTLDFQSSYLTWMALGVGLALVAVLVLRNAAPAGSQPNPDPAVVPTPALDAITDQKTLVVDIEFNGREAATLGDARIVRSAGRARVGDPPLLLLTTYDHDGQMIEEVNGWHPLWTHVWGTDGERLDVEEVATGTFQFPFNPQMSSLKVEDPGLEEQVGDIDLDPAIADFCEDNPSDPDCETDLGISKSDSGYDPAVAGTQVIYVLAVQNLGDNPARSYEVVDTLPAGVTFADADAVCEETSEGVVTCQIDEPLGPGESAELSITVDVDPGLVYDNGGPVTLVNSATVENLSGGDTDPSNDSVDEETLVVAEADLEIVSFASVDAPLAVLIGQPVEVQFAKTITSNGPSSPMDVAVQATIDADAGLSVAADAGNPGSELALADGEERELSQFFTVSCLAPGSHTLTIENEIAPLHADDTDPDPSNNHAEASITVDCVVPVAINIKPGDFPNKINLKSKGVIPVAVLSTDVSEYGLPVAFDATTIDPLSVRFGTESALFNVGLPGGASEDHEMGHPDDSYELDESTQDGDTDMVLHFATQDAGLSSGDAEACVIGTFTGIDGNTYTFFGCDSIEVK